MTEHTAAVTFLQEGDWLGIVDGGRKWSGSQSTESPSELFYFLPFIYLCHFQLMK